MIENFLTLALLVAAPDLSAIKDFIQRRDTMAYGLYVTEYEAVEGDYLKVIVRDRKPAPLSIVPAVEACKYISSLAWRHLPETFAVELVVKSHLGFDQTVCRRPR